MIKLLVTRIFQHARHKRALDAAWSIALTQVASPGQVLYLIEELVPNLLRACEDATAFSLIVRVAARSREDRRAICAHWRTCREIERLLGSETSPTRVMKLSRLLSREAHERELAELGQMHSSPNAIIFRAALRSRVNARQTARLIRVRELEIDKTGCLKHSRESYRRNESILLFVAFTLFLVCLHGPLVLCACTNWTLLMAGVSVCLSGPILVWIATRPWAITRLCKSVVALATSQSLRLL